MFDHYKDYTDIWKKTDVLCSYRIKIIFRKSSHHFSYFKKPQSIVEITLTFNYTVRSSFLVLIYSKCFIPTSEYFHFRTEQRFLYLKSHFKKIEKIIIKHKIILYIHDLFFTVIYANLE